MEGVLQHRLDLMGSFHNKVVKTIDGSKLNALEIIYVLDNLLSSMKPLVRAPKKLDKDKK